MSNILTYLTILVPAIVTLIGICIDHWFEEMTRYLSDRQKNDLKRKWSTLERLTSASERIRRIALDMYNHF